MPLQKLIFKPGVNREGTTLTNEGSWFETDKVRFRSGFPEKLGGWVAISSNTFMGVCRSLWNWVTLKNFNLLGVGTNQKFYVENGGSFYDITPIYYDTLNTLSAVSIDADSMEATFTVSPAPSFQTGDIVNISGIPSAVGDIAAEILNQQYQIIFVSGTQFKVLMREVSSLEAPGPYVTSTTGGTASGLTADVEYLLQPGLPIYAVGTGWGVGPWSPYESVSLTNPFSTTASSSILTVNYGSAHGLSVGDYVTFASIQNNFGSLQINASMPVTQAVLLRTFEVATTPTASTFTVSMVSGSGVSTVTITATATASAVGGAVTMYRQSASSVIYGWGDGYTASAGTGLQMRLWTQANFGENLIINPRGGAIYLWLPGSGPAPDYATRAALITTADDIPAQVNEVMVSDATRIVIAFGCTDYQEPIGTGDFDPMLIRWSTNENYNVWLPSATNQAGSYRLSHGSEIVTALQTRQEILVWTDAAVYSMQYLGPPYVWGFNILADNVSLISPNAVATANGAVFWMGVDKFYAYNGRVETLPSALRQYVFEDLNKSQAYQIFASTNEGYSEIWWFYCSVSGPNGLGTPSNPNTVIDRYVVYNYLENVWYYGSMHRTAWLDSALRPFPQATASVQTTVVTGASVGVSDTQIQVENSSSFPSSGYLQIGSEVIAYTGNSGVVFSGCERGQFGTTAATHEMGTQVIAYGENVILYHESGVDDVSVPSNPRPIESFIQSSDIDLDDGDRYVFVWQMVPDFSFDGSSSTASPEVQVQLRPRQNPGAAYGYGASPTVASAQDYQNKNTYTVQEFTEVVNTRIRGRQMALKIASSKLGTKWQLGAMRINMRPDGRR